MKKVGTPKKPVFIGLTASVPSVPSFLSKNKRERDRGVGERGRETDRKVFSIFCGRWEHIPANPITTGKNAVPTYWNFDGTKGTHAA